MHYFELDVSNKLANGCLSFLFLTFPYFFSFGSFFFFLLVVLLVVLLVILIIAGKLDFVNVEA